MVWQFARNLLFVLIILLVIGGLVETNLLMTEEAKEYLHFVLTTDFKIESFTTPVQEVFQRFKEKSFSIQANSTFGAS